MMLNSIYRVIFISIVVTCGAAQSLRFEHIGEDGQLSQSTIMSVIQDSKGFVWIGTWDGLNRFDGYTFRQFHNDPNDGTSLPNNSINHIVEDVQQDLWLSTAGGGVVWFDRRTETFHQDFLDDRTGSVKRIPFSQNLCTPDGKTIVALYNEQLYIIDARSKRIRHIQIDTIPPVSFSRDECEGAYLVVTGKRLMALFPDGRILSQDLFRDPERKRMIGGSFRMTTLDDGTMLFATRAHGIWTFDWNQRELVPAFEHTRDPNSLSDNRVNFLFKDSRGDVWAATDNGLNRADRNSGGAITGFQRYTTDASDPFSISFARVYVIAEDRSGMLWIGTQKGLNTLLPQRKKFQQVPKNASFQTMMKGLMPIALFEENDSTLWIGTTGSLFRYNMRSGNWRSIVPAINGNKNSRVLSMFKDRRGKMWITTESGVAQFDPVTHQYRPVKFPISPGWENEYSRINSLAEDRNGMIWAATARGLMNIDPVSLRNTRYFFDTVAAGENNSNFISMLIEGDTIWAGNIYRGLMKYRISDGSFLLLQNRDKDTTSLPHNTPMSIHRDRSNRLWIATLGGGLAELVTDGTRTHFRRFNSRQGLPNNQVYGILEDDHGNLWLSTNNGLSQFDTKKESFTNYTMNDGLPTLEFNQNSYHRGRSSRFYFGGISGIVAFLPSEIRIDTIPPPVVITGFSLFNKERNDLLRNESIVLTYEENFFSFEFSSLAFESPAENKYSWKLEGFDKEWSIPSNRRFATYTGVPPGTYTFTVKASNGDGVWNHDGASIRVIIVPPFWGTMWFRVISIALFILMLAGSVRYAAYRKYRRRIDELEQQKRLLEERQRTRDKIARDLHDDLASTVGSAGLFVETAKRTLGENAGQTLDYLEKTSSILNEAEETMSDIVWSVSPKHDTLHSLTTRIRLVTTELCRAHGIRSTVEVKGNIDIPLTDEVRRGLYLIFKESLNNCIKHSRTPAIEISIEHDQQNIILIVQDHGNGFPADQQQESLGGNGLNNIRKRSEEIGAKLTVTSVPNSGVTIRVVKDLTQMSH